VTPRTGYKLQGFLKNVTKISQVSWLQAFPPCKDKLDEHEETQDDETAKQKAEHFP